jgi:hypothetical protein
MHSIIKDDEKDRCYICGKYGEMQTHHLLHGTANRKQADKYGLTVHLCHRCHMRLHDEGVFDRNLQRIAQTAFEAKYSHEEWMRIFGKNYILEDKGEK